MCVCVYVCMCVFVCVDDESKVPESEAPCCFGSNPPKSHGSRKIERDWTVELMTAALV